MDPITLLCDDLHDAHDLLEAVMADVTPEAAAWIPPGRANPVGATYAHVVLSEDRTIHTLLQHEPPLYDSGWADKLGLSEGMPDQGADMQGYVDWTRRVSLDLPVFQAYARAVYADSDRYLASLTPTDLDRVLDMSGIGMGKDTVARILSRQVVAHADNIAGEISCLKGLQGLRGYPF